jgi:hypothetical protein
MSEDTSPLLTAQVFVNLLEEAQTRLNTFLAPTLQDYIDFLPERGAAYTPGKYTNASGYTFKEVDTSHFIFESPEYYEYGDYEKDVVELPFAFVEDPEAYKTKLRDEISAAAKKFSERQAATELANVKRLEAQLEAAKKRAGL